MNGTLGEWAVVVGLTVLAVLLTILGVHDATVRNAPFWVNALGVIFIAIAVVLATAAWILRSHLVGKTCSEITNRWVLVGTLTAAATGAYFALAARRGEEPAAWLLPVALLTIGASATAYFKLKRHLRTSIPGIEKSLLGLLATAVGVGQFWYSSQYLPAEAPTALNVQTLLERIGTEKRLNGDLDILRGRVVVTNPSDTKLRLVASSYSVSGSQVRPAGQLSGTWVVDQQVQAFQSAKADAFDLTTVRSDPTVLKAAKLFEDGWYFDAHEVAERVFLVYLPKQTYDIASLRVTLVAARYKQLRIVPATPSTAESTVTYVHELKDDSLLHKLVDGSGWQLTVTYELGRHVSPSVNLTKGQSQETETQVALTAEKAGLAATSSTYHMPLTDGPLALTQEPVPTAPPISQTGTCKRLRIRAMTQPRSAPIAMYKNLCVRRDRPTSDAERCRELRLSGVAELLQMGPSLCRGLWHVVPVGAEAEQDK